MIIWEANLWDVVHTLEHFGQVRVLRGQGSRPGEIRVQRWIALGGVGAWCEVTTQRDRCFFLEQALREKMRELDAFAEGAEMNELPPAGDAAHAGEHT